MIASENLVAHEELVALCKKYRIRELSVFGSVARGEGKADSDVDLLVEFEAGVVHGLDYFALEEELARLFGRPVDLATKKWLKASVRSEILRDAQVLYAA